MLLFFNFFALSCKTTHSGLRDGIDTHDTSIETAKQLMIDRLARKFALGLAAHKDRPSTRGTHYASLEEPDLKYWIRKALGSEIVESSFIDSKTNGFVREDPDVETGEPSPFRKTRKENPYGTWDKFQIIGREGNGKKPQWATYITLEVVSVKDGSEKVEEFGTLSYILDADMAPNLVRNYLILSTGEEKSGMNYFVANTQSYKEEMGLLCVVKNNEDKEVCGIAGEKSVENWKSLGGLANLRARFNVFMEKDNFKYDLKKAIPYLKLFRKLEFQNFQGIFPYVGSREGEDPYFMDAENNVNNDGNGNLTNVEINKGDLIVFVNNTSGRSSPWLGKGQATKLAINPFTPDELREKLKQTNLYRPSRLGVFNGNTEIIDRLVQIANKSVPDTLLRIKKIVNKSWEGETFDQLFIRGLEYPNVPLIDEQYHPISGK